MSLSTSVSSLATRVATEFKTLRASLGTAAGRNVPASGNAAATEVVLGSDTRLSASSSGTLPTRTTTSIATASLAAGTAETGTKAITAGFRVLKVSTDYPAKVQLYASATYRDADASRSVWADPTGDHGVLLEVVTVPGALSYDMTPAPDCYADSGTTIAYRVTNADTAARAITVTLTYLKTE